MRDGFIITEGVAYAKAVIFRNEPVTITKTLISDAQIDNEIALYTSARDRTYELFKNEAQNATSQTTRDFLETAILYLIDPYIAEQIKEQILAGIEKDNLFIIAPEESELVEPEC